MNRSVLFFITITVIVILLIVSPIALKIHESANNQMIDFSCNTDSDCAIKPKGCDICKGIQMDCMNKDSVDGICYEFDFLGLMGTCQALTPPPKSCSYIENECINFG